MVQEWIGAIMSDTWLLGFAMGVAGKRIVDGLNMIRRELLSGDKSDSAPVNDDAKRQQ